MVTVKTLMIVKYFIFKSYFALSFPAGIFEHGREKMEQGDFPGFLRFSRGYDLHRRFAHLLERLAHCSDRKIQAPGDRISEPENPALLRNPDSQAQGRGQNLCGAVIVRADKRRGAFRLRQVKQRSRSAKWSCGS